jgi:hypothetical protein
MGIGCMTGIRTVAALSVLAGTAVRADPPPEAAAAPPPASSLQVRLLPGVYLPRLNGDASLGSGAPDIDLADDLGLDDQEPTLNVELTVRMEEILEVIIGGFDFSTESSGYFVGSGSFGNLVLNDGDRFRASFDMTSISAEVAVALWRPYADGSARGGDNRNPDGRYVVDLRISPVFGLRYLDVDQALSVSGSGRETTGDEWLALLVGGDVTLEYRPGDQLPLLDMFGMQAGFSAGPALGGEGGTVWQVRGGLTLQFTENVGVLIGYRLVELDVESDDYNLEGGLQGLFLAASIRF